MKEIGQKLKEAREEQGLSLNEVSEMTKIRSLYLKAIEDGDMSRTPGAVYAKGFLKAYASAVGLNPNEILAEYQSFLNQLPPEEPEELPEIRVMKATAPKPIGKIVTTIVVIALVGGGLFFVKNLWSTIKNETIPQLLEPEPEVSQGIDDQLSTSPEPAADQNQTDVDPVVNPEEGNPEASTDNPEPGAIVDDSTMVDADGADEADTTTTTDTPAKEVVDATPQENADSTDQVVTKPQEPATKPVNTDSQVADKKLPTEPTPPKESEPVQKQPDESTGVAEKKAVQPVQTEKKVPAETQIEENEVQKEMLQVIATGDSWVRVKVDGKTAFQGQLKKGETRLYEGLKFNLRIGNGQAIQVNYHGMIMGPFGSENELVEKVFGE